MNSLNDILFIDVERKKNREKIIVKNHPKQFNPSSISSIFAKQKVDIFSFMKKQCSIQMEHIACNQFLINSILSSRAVPDAFFCCFSYSRRLRLVRCPQFQMFSCNKYLINPRNFLREIIQ